MATKAKLKAKPEETDPVKETAPVKETTPAAPAKPKNLYQRISAVMQDVRFLTKDDEVGTGSYSYKGVSEENVTTAVRESLIKNGLVILPVHQAHKQEDKQRHSSGKQTIVSLTTVDVVYKIVNIDKPEEFELVNSSGTGVDSQDKGVGKAMTYSYKNMLLRVFGIPTGEDADKFHNRDLEAAQAQNAPAPQKQQAPPPKQQTQQQDKPLEKAMNKKQQGEIESLLNHDLITPDEQKRGLAALKTLDFFSANEAIEKYKKAIAKREAAINNQEGGQNNG